MGVSENRLNPIYPMVLLIIIPMKNGYFIGGIPYFLDWSGVSFHQPVEQIEKLRGWSHSENDRILKIPKDRIQRW